LRTLKAKMADQIVYLMGFWEQPDHVLGYLSAPARSIMLVLTAMFLISMAVSAERMIRYSYARRQTRRLVRESNGAFLSRNEAEVRRFCSAAAQSHVAALVIAALKVFSATRVNLGRRQAVEIAEWEMLRSKSAIYAELNRRLAVLATIASTAPFLGLLGTVFGILDSFRGVGMARATVISMMAGTIAEALITTAAGISVAVPTLWSYNLLSGRLELMNVEMEVASRELTTYLVKIAEAR